jgi:[NiFe] hydrogenase assembly HybE family chaperone
MIYPEHVSRGLERVFNRIQQERMQGVPVLNEVLQVEAVGFTPWQGHCVGVLISPWFMNLMLLPDEGDDWGHLSVGEKVTHLFPSGPYEFIAGDEEGIGRYQMCSLFSPVFQFADQAAAVATAEAVMQALMDEENREQIDMDEKEVQRRWHGEPEQGEINEDELMSRPTLEERLEQPISRRDLLTGSFQRDP